MIKSLRTQNQEMIIDSTIDDEITLEEFEKTFDLFV